MSTSSADKRTFRPDPFAVRDRAGPGQQLPSWSRVLVVVAHPDDETFGLGAVIDLMARAGAEVRILCFTHGEASTLNATGASLHAVRSDELRHASDMLGAAAVELLDYGDGRLAATSGAELAGRVLTASDSHPPDGLLVFDENGITGHADHQAATRAALRAAEFLGLPVLAWTLPAAVADQLREETGQPFTGQPPGQLHLRVPVSRTAQRHAAAAHASQISPTAVLWRRLQLLGDWEYLRWLRH